MQIYYFYVPSVLVAIKAGLEEGLTAPGGYYQFFGNQSATPAEDALKQWASCGYLQARRCVLCGDGLGTHRSSHPVAATATAAVCRLRSGTAG